MKYANKIKIIAGKWRSRLLPVLDSTGLRPTSSRLRETLFNWLMNDINDATCLDLFAGSGALGFEALSRGAKRVIFVEKDRAVTEQLQHNAKTLETKDAEIICAGAEKVSEILNQDISIIFVDPPFKSNLLQISIKSIADYYASSPRQVKIFIEAAEKSDHLLPTGFKIIKSSKIGKVHAALWQKI